MTTDRTQKLMARVSQILVGSVFAVLFASFFFSELFPWSRRDFSIPTQSVAPREEDRFGVWHTETRVLLRDTTVFWRQKLAEEGIDYVEPSLSFMFGEVKDLCGTGFGSELAAYCPFTQEIVVDTAEYQSVSRQVGMRNHLAVAYSFAHQIGHHVQHLRGKLERHVDEEPSLHVQRIEQQADCYAGIWLRSAEGPYGEFDFHDVYVILTQFYPRHTDLPLPKVPDVILETRDYADAQQRTDWVRTGFRSGDSKACGTTLASPAQK